MEGDVERALPEGALSVPAVAADEYDEDYYRTCCAGSAEWEASQGATVAGIYPGMLKAAGFVAGEVVVDVGTGRGELPVVAARWGSPRAIGVEYSAAAVRLAEQTAAVHEVGDRVEFLLADARRIPLPDACADLVTLLDVVEHLAPAELSAALSEARRILRPGGRVFIHTFPTSTMYDVTYRWLRAMTIVRRWPADPRNDYERRMHVNEQSLRSLRRALRECGFVSVDVRSGDWVHVDHLPAAWARWLVRRLARLRATSSLGRSDLIATARRSE